MKNTHDMVPITYTPLLLCKPFWSSQTQPFSYSSCRNTPFSDKKILYWGFLIASKLHEKNSRVDLSLAGGHISASTTREKKGSSYPSHINTPICVLKMLYWQSTDITKSEREMMVSWQTTVWTTKFYYLLVKSTSHCLRNPPMWLVLCGTELLHVFLGICCSHTRSVSIHPPKHPMLPSLDCLQLYGYQCFWHISFKVSNV